MVNEQVFRGNWSSIRGRVKEKWGALTDDDLVLAEGNVDQLIGIIERRTGESREKIEHDLDQLTSDYGSQMDRIRQQATAAGEGAREYADQASDLARQQYEQLQAQYSQVAADLQAKYAEAEAAVRRKPVESILVAFGTGLVAGALAGLLLRPRD